MHYTVRKPHLKHVASAHFLCHGQSVTAATLEGTSLADQTCSSREMVGRNQNRNVCCLLLATLQKGAQARTSQSAGR